MQLRAFPVLARLLAASLLVSACGGDEGPAGPVDPSPGTPPAERPATPPVSISLSAPAISVAAGQTHQLAATVTGTTNTGVTWSSSATGVATVSAAGVVTALAPGITTITARSVADAGRFATAAVTVTQGSGSGGATALTSGSPVGGIGGAEDSQRLYRIAVPAGATRLVVTTAGGSGDVDLYLRAGAAPTSSATDCASEGGDNTERCAVDNPAAGDWYVLLVGFEAYSGVTLTATVTAGATSPSPGTPGFTLAVSPSSVTLARGGSATISVTATRTGGFVGPIDLATEGFASGLSGGSGVRMAANLSSVTMTLTAAASAATGASTVTVRGRATGLPDATATVVVTVPAATPNPSLVARVVGDGVGEIDPAGGQYAPGTRLTVRAEEGLYSEFRGWEGPNCTGGLGGCIVTFENSDIAMTARFEPIVWRATFSLDYQASSSAIGCTWTVRWIDSSVDVTYVRSGAGQWTGKLRLRGRRTATSTDSRCTPAEATVDRTVDFAPTGWGVNVTFGTSSSGVSSETMTVGIMQLNRWPAQSLGGITATYGGTGRSGSGTLPILPWVVVR